jgi:hypothetical protein
MSYIFISGFQLHKYVNPNLLTLLNEDQLNCEKHLSNKNSDLYILYYSVT